MKNEISYTIPRWAKFPRLKPGQTGREAHRLVYHGLDVASVLEAGLQRNPALLGQLAALLGMAPHDSRAMMLTLTALHDIGKVLASFQAMEPEAMAQVGHEVHHGHRPYSRREAGHDAAGWALFWVLRQRQDAGRIADALPAPCLGRGTNRSFKTLVTAFTGHHGGPRDADWDRHFAAFAEPEADIAAAASYARSMAEHYGWRTGFPTAEAAARASYLVNGLVTLCDWLGSAEDFALVSRDMPVAEYVERYARPTAEQVLDRVQPAIFAAPGVSPPLAFRELFAHLNPGGPVVPSPMQAACERLFEAEASGEGPLLLVIEDMTGSGKTEGGDYAVHRLVASGRAHGVYAGLPTTTTADQAYERRGDVFDKMWSPRVGRVLAHGRSRQNLDFKSTAEPGKVEAGEAACVEWFARSSRTALLAMAGVGTVDQALLGALRARYAGLRLLGLWGKVLVVDEVHAYDGYMLAVLEKLLEAQARHGGSAILLSATLPSRERARLVAAFRRGLGLPEPLPEQTDPLDPLAFPALTVVHGGAPPRLVEGIAAAPGPGALERVFARVGSVEEAAAAVLAHAAAGRSVVWFRNTVDQAREAYDGLLEEAGARGLPEPLLWHARFLPADRKRIEAAVLGLAGKGSAPEERRGRIVVATQVGEQSLDLDFDAVVTDLAPIESLIQRVGRGRRHRRVAAGRLKAGGADERPNTAVTVLAPDPGQVREGWYEALLGRAKWVYPDEARLWLGLTHLLDPATIPGRVRAGPIVLDDDLKRLIESVYADDECVRGRVPEALRPALDAAQGGAMVHRQAGCRNRLGFGKGLLADITEAGAYLPDDDGALLDAPTRLGESHTLLLVFDEEGRVGLAGAGGIDPIADSELRVRRRLVQPEGEAAREALGPALTRAQQVRVGFATPIVLRRDGEAWTGTAREENGPELRLRYCPRRGLVTGR